MLTFIWVHKKNRTLGSRVELGATKIWLEVDSVILRHHLLLYYRSKQVPAFIDPLLCDGKDLRQVGIPILVRPRPLSVRWCILNSDSSLHSLEPSEFFITWTELLAWGPSSEKA